MKLSDIELPSNKKFGFFLSVVFLIASLYFWYLGNFVITYIFLFITIAFFTITIIKASILLPINKLWMRFGLMLGMIVSPIILGIIFFGMFTPIALFLRLIGRDELRLSLRGKSSNWINKDKSPDSESFKYQF